MSSKVTPEAIQEYRSGIPIREILDRYCVSKTQFYRRLRKEITTNREQGPSADDWVKIVADYTAGKTLSELETVYNTSTNTLSIGLKKRRIEIRKPSEYSKIYAEEDKQLAIANYQAGMSIETAGESSGASYATVSRWLEAAGIPIRSQIRCGGNRDFFKTIDNEQAAYWFGFLAADGYISKKRSLTILLSRKDRAHLELFNTHLHYNGKIKDEDRIRHWPDRPAKMYQQSRLRLCSTNLCKDLLDHGLAELKSGDPTPLSKLTTDMLKHFIRGYFDGDGSIYQVGAVQSWRWYICAKSSLFLTKLGTYLIAAGITKTNVYRSGKYQGYIYRLCYQGKKAKMISSWLYGGSTVYLERKHVLAQQLIVDT